MSLCLSLVRPRLTRPWRADPSVWWPLSREPAGYGPDRWASARPPLLVPGPTSSGTGSRRPGPGGQSWRPSRPGKADRCKPGPPTGHSPTGPGRRWAEGQGAGLATDRTNRYPGVDGGQNLRIVGGWRRWGSSADTGVTIAAGDLPPPWAGAPGPPGRRRLSDG